MAAQNPPWAVTGVAESAETARRAIRSIMGGPGVVGQGDLFVQAQSTPNNTVQIAAGEVWIPGTSQTYQGNYYARNDATVNLTISANSSGLTRYDLICAQMVDTDYTSGSMGWSLIVVTGTPGSGPPAVPTSATTLAQITVASGFSSITNANITDIRTRATVTGFSTRIVQGTYTNQNVVAIATSPPGTQWGTVTIGPYPFLVNVQLHANTDVLLSTSADLYSVWEVSGSGIGPTIKANPNNVRMPIMVTALDFSVTANTQKTYTINSYAASGNFTTEFGLVWAVVTPA